MIRRDEFHESFDESGQRKALWDRCGRGSFAYGVRSPPSNSNLTEKIGRNGKETVNFSSVTPAYEAALSSGIGGSL